MRRCLDAWLLLAVALLCAGVVLAQQPPATPGKRVAHDSTRSGQD